MQLSLQIEVSSAKRVLQTASLPFLGKLCTNPFKSFSHSMNGNVVCFGQSGVLTRSSWLQQSRNDGHLEMNAMFYNTVVPRTDF